MLQRLIYVHLDLPFLLSQPTQAGLPQIVESPSEELRIRIAVTVGRLHYLQEYAAADYCSILSYKM
jgi:hypothetical protein